MSNNSVSIGLPGLLAVLFVGLKLCKVIAWSWLWVLSPLWIPFFIIILVLIFVSAGLILA